MYSLSGVQDNGNELTELERQRNKTELQGTVGLGFGRRRMYSLNTISKPEEPGVLPAARQAIRYTNEVGADWRRSQKRGAGRFRHLVWQAKSESLLSRT
jgi:hypothetical protein